MSEERIDHPPHYTSHPSGVECVEIAEHMSFNLGNALKYVWRMGLKGEGTRLEDVKKALWYVEREAKVCDAGLDHHIIQPGAGGDIAWDLAKKVVLAAPVTLSGIFLQILLDPDSEDLREMNAILKLSIACLESSTGQDAQARLAELLEQGLNARNRRT